MTVFNSWYYSFSPTVAQFEYAHSTVRMIIRTGLYPLIGILHLSSFTYAMLGAEPELAVLASGLIASFFIGLVYIAPPASCLLWLSKKRIRIRSRDLAKWVGLGFATATLAFILAEAFTATWLMMIASSAILLVTLASASALGIYALRRES